MFAPCPRQTKQDNCSALACGLYSHVQHLPFWTRAEVAAWCQSKIKIKILWQLNPITLQKTASTQLFWLCAAKCMIIGHNFISNNKRSKIINLKSKMRGVCSCKTRFLWFLWSDKEGGSDESKSLKIELVNAIYGGLYFFGGIIDMWMYKL